MESKGYVVETKRGFQEETDVRRERERNSVISVSPDCGPLTSRRRLEPRVTVLIIMRVFARGTRLRCARVRVDALTVRLNAINAPLDSCRLGARYRGERSSNRINRFVAPLRSRETVHCASARMGGEAPVLESSSRFFLILVLPPFASARFANEG